METKEYLIQTVDAIVQGDIDAARDFHKQYMERKSVEVYNKIQNDNVNESLKFTNIETGKIDNVFKDKPNNKKVFKKNKSVYGGIGMDLNDGSDADAGADGGGE